MMQTKTPVVVLGSGRHGSLGVVRSLGRLGAPVFIVDSDPRALSLASKYCRQGFMWDFQGASPEQSAEYLAKLGRKLGGQPILFPVTDSSALLVAAHASILREQLRFPDVHYELLQALCSKKEMHFLAQRIGIPTPQTCFPASRQHVTQFAEETGFPLIIKPVEADRALREAGREKAIVREKRQLLETYELMENPDRPNLMVQEYIPGGEEANWMFNGYFSENSHCLFGITGRKIRQYRPHVGITSLGVCQRNPVVTEATIRLISGTGYRGILDIDYRFDARTGTYKVLDVNPRIGWTFRLFVSDTGMDVVRAMYLDLTGQAVLAGDAQAGRRWMVEDWDFASCLQHWREGKLTVREWLKSFDGVQETALFARDDMRPALRVFINDVRHLFRKVGLGARRAKPAHSIAGLRGHVKRP